MCDTTDLSKVTSEVPHNIPHLPQIARTLRSGYAGLPAGGPQPRIRIRSFKPLKRNSLKGFAAVELPSAMTIVDVAIGSSHAKWWAMPLSKPMIDGPGLPLWDKNRKVRYQPIIDFRETDRRRRWSEQVIAAEPFQAALREIHRRGQDIIGGKRLVGGPRAVAFDLASVAGNALGIEVRGPEPAEQETWIPELTAAQRKKRQWRAGGR